MATPSIALAYKRSALMTATKVTTKPPSPEVLRARDNFQDFCVFMGKSPANHMLEYAYAIGRAFDISKQQQRRSQAIAKAKGRQMQRAAEPKVKSAGKSGSTQSRRNAQRAKGRSFNAAYHYGYDPNQSMR